MTTVLMTLGRLPKALDLARGFSAAGCRVIVAEPFNWHLTGTSRSVARNIRVPAPADGKAAYLDALAGIVTREAVDIVVPVSEETMHVAFLRGRLPEHVRLFTMPPQQVLALHDKGGFIAAGRAAGVCVPDTAALGSEAARALAASGGVVVKPVFTCSGRGLHILPQGADLPQADSANPAIVQRFIPGRVHSSCTLAHQGRALATTIYRGTIMSGTVSAAFERVDHPGITAWIDRFVAHVRWSGFISFDFIVDEAGAAHGIECNPRATSGVHFWQPEAIARAVLDPAGAPPVQFRPQAELQQFYSCLTEILPALFGGRDFVARWRKLLTTRDVTWDWRDPLPFLTMIPTSWKIISMAARRGVSFGEVATLDVGWYEDPA